jgi:hypothetical protein
VFGTIPGKPVKRKNSAAEDAQKRKEYGDTKRSRSFQNHWKVGLEWLMYDRKQINEL